MGGAALAFEGVRLLVVVAPATVPLLDEVSINIPVLLFAAGISILSAVAFGLLPALHSLRVKPQTALQSSSTRVANNRNAAATRSLMVAAQIACTVVLLIITTVVLRSFSPLMHESRGFETSHVTLAEVDLFTPEYGDNRGMAAKAARLALVDRVLAALSQLPGVQSAAVTSVAPLTGETWVDNLFRPDHPVPAGKEPAINVRWIDPQYLSTMHIPVVAGRNFTAADRTNPYVALISEKTPREGFPGEIPLGHNIVNIVPDDEHAVKVIGVVADTHINGLKDDAAMVYLPYWDYPPFSVSFLVRSSRSETAVAPEVRRAIWQIDPQLAVPLLKSMDEQVSESVATDRFEAILLSCFGTAALLLALLGIYGVLTYSVSLRHQEFGIRIALGSGKGALVRLVLSQAAYPVLLGMLFGLWASRMFLRWVHALLYQAPTLDLTSIGGTVLLLLFAAAVAATVPTRRAASVDPIRALRVQ